MPAPTTCRSNEDEIDQLVKAADIVTMARTAVERDYRGEVIDAHAPEMPTRFAKQLAQMVRGGVAIGMSRKAAMRLAIRCARDSIPPLRLEILLDVAANPSTTFGRGAQAYQQALAHHQTRTGSADDTWHFECDEEEEDEDEVADYRHKRQRQWFYSISPNFDVATLQAMDGKVVSEKVKRLRDAGYRLQRYAKGGSY